MAMARPSLLHHFKSLNKISFAQRRCLSIHEYQAQHLLAQYEVPVPRGSLATTAAEAANLIDDFGGQGVIKSQILAGGRGKGSFGNGFKGGVRVVSSVDEGRKISAKMLGQRLCTNQTPPEGLPVDKVYVVEQLSIGHEYYLAITTDRANASPVLVMSQGGGTGIEELAAKDPGAVVKVPLKYTQGVTAEIISLICERFALQAERVELTALLQRLFAFFKERDATLVEINPLIRESKTGRFICADSKVSIDNAASKRQSEIFGLRDRSQEMPVELEAEKHGLVYIQLEGNIGCLVNGAGLAMATNDAVAHYGGRCANFLDGGGQATKETMVKAFELILSDKRVHTILVNIYGGKSGKWIDRLRDVLMLSFYRYHPL
ncbi:hypothetical protein IMSHALPRED_002635 [Imshaugia aleurites]|uniref:ATP-grasp domain-containing protein n=1 Tax=Imshaugia aleurites TaxID=172621 RepID=A0A8H3F1Y1_9LECA|nr:hypothetical protein IMSHALPRED_002635 [Imshaugia aleurites]